MTTLYKPVLIESVEQAEKLPIGTIGIDYDSSGQTSDPAIRVANGWHVAGYAEPDGFPTLFKHSEMVHSYALVPVKAEEEARVTPEALAAAAGQTLARVEEAARTYALPPTPLTIQQQTRYVTPWESA